MSVALQYGEGVFATGVKRYADSLQAEYVRLGVDAERVLLARRELRVGPIRAGGFLSLWAARATERRTPHDVVHALDPAVATARTHVVTVHDIIAETHAHWYQHDLMTRLDLRFTRRYARRVPYIIAVSEYTRDAVIQRWGVPPERVRTIHLGIDHTLFRPLDAPAKALSSDKPNLLFVGDDNPRKNIILSVRAIAQLKARHGIEARLVRIGADKFPGVHLGYRQEAARLGVDLVEPGALADDDLVATLSGADALVWPTLAEGFGFPPLEAMACGTQVVALDTPINREVCSTAARYHAESPEAAADALAEALAKPMPRETLVRHASAFTWRRTAEQTLAVYDEVRASRKGQRI